MTAHYFGYCDEKFVLVDLAAHILLTAFSSVGDEAVLFGLEKYISSECQSACYSFIDDWNNSPDSERLFEVASEIEEHFGLSKKLEKLDTEILLRSDSLPCIDEAIISRAMRQISKNIIKTDEIVNAVESRRTSKWYERYEHYYNKLYCIAKMQGFHYEHISGFHVGRYKELWDEYSKELYIMDTYYRRLRTSFNKSLRNSFGMIDDLFKQAIETAEKLFLPHTRYIYAASFQHPLATFRLSKPIKQARSSNARKFR